MAAKKKMQENFELSAAPNKRYETFFGKFKETKTLEPAKWKSVHLIAHFVELYEKHFGVKYSFKFNHTAPSKCYETFQIKRLAGMLGTDPVLLKEYIDWVFDTKLTSNKYTFRVIGFLVNETFITEFKFKQNRAKQVTRTSILPPRLMQVVQDCGFENINTYGDLAFLKALAEGGDDERSSKCIEELKAVGFDVTALEKVK